MQGFNKTLDILRANRIKCGYRTVNYSSSRNNIIGRTGENENFSVMYYYLVLL